MLALLVAVAAAMPAAADVLERGVFTVQYSQQDAALAEPTMRWLEEAAREFGDFLPTGDDPIRLIIVKDFVEFSQFAPHLAQAKVSGVAKSERGIVAVKPPRLRDPGGDYRGTVRHELVHVLLHRNLDTDNVPRWLNEGLCMSLANEYRWASTLEVGKSFLAGTIIPYRKLNTAFFAPGEDLQFSNAYGQALSMTRYLRNKVGEETFWEMILATKEQNFPRALEDYAGMTVSEFWTRYQRSLWLFALISVLTSGSIFGPIAVLSIITYLRKRHGNKKTLRQWAREEAEDDADPLEVFDWDHILEDADAWKGEQDEESDPR